MIKILTIDISEDYLYFKEIFDVIWLIFYNISEQIARQ